MNQIRQPSHLPAFFALAVSLCITLIFWNFAGRSVDQQAENEFREEAKEITLLVSQRLNVYLNVLYGAQGFFAASREVKNHEWRIYAEKLELRQRYPGIQAIRFLERVKAKEKRDFESDMQHDGSYDFLGYPEFKIHPENPGAEYFVIKYIEPLAGNQWMFGVDEATDALYGEVLKRARDENRPIASGLLNVQKGRQIGAAGFQVCMPVFREGAALDTLERRRAAHIGFVDIVLKTDDLLSPALYRRLDRRSGLEFEVYDGSLPDDNNLFYASQGPEARKKDPSYQPRFILSTSLDIPGRTWTLYFSTTPKFRLDPIQENFPIFVLYGGFVLSLLFFGIFYSISLSRTRAVELADKITKDLRVEAQERARAEEELRKAVQVKMDFTSTVSHELRTPLSAIKESVAIIEDGSAGPVSDEQKDLLTTAVRNVERLARLIDAVLDYQKLDSQKAHFHKTENDLNEFVAEVVKGFIPIAKKKKVQLEFAADPKAGAASFDHDKIAQVLVNLLDNALKFTETGRIQVKTSRIPKFVRISVIDQGIGIDAADTHKLFKSFSQVNRTGARKTGGTGLGLAISKKIVEAHQGSIGVESIPGSGSTFFFELPV